GQTLVPEREPPRNLLFFNVRVWNAGAQACLSDTAIAGASVSEAGRQCHRYGTDAPLWRDTADMPSSAQSRMLTFITHVRIYMKSTYPTASFHLVFLRRSTPSWRAAQSGRESCEMTSC